MTLLLPSVVVETIKEECKPYIAYNGIDQDAANKVMRAVLIGLEAWPEYTTKEYQKEIMLTIKRKLQLD